MEGMRERILQIIKELNLSVTAFERKCGLSNGYVKAVKRDFSLKKLEGILKAFPQIRREWLLYGTGDMFNNVTQTATNATAIGSMAGGVVNNIATSAHEKIISPDGRTTIEPLYAEVIALREENKALKEKVALLERIIAEKETIISLLK